jgi:hypothetical protein
MGLLGKFCARDGTEIPLQKRASAMNGIKKDHLSGERFFIIKGFLKNSN